MRTTTDRPYRERAPLANSALNVELIAGSASARWLADATHGQPVSHQRARLVRAQQLVDLHRAHRERDQATVRDLVIAALEGSGCTFNGWVREGVELYLSHALDVIDVACSERSR